MQTRFLFLAGLLGLTTLTAQAQQLNTAKLDSLLTALSTHRGQRLYLRRLVSAISLPHIYHV